MSFFPQQPSERDHEGEISYVLGKSNNNTVIQRL